MKLALLLLGLGVLLVLAGVVGMFRARMERHGALTLAWRFLTGHPWHGKAVTDAGWLRPGSRALTRTGHASRFQHRPRLHRTAMRAIPTAAVLAALWGLVTHRALTLDALAVAAAAGLAVALWAAIRAARKRRHHRQWVEPLHTTVAPLVGVPVERSPASWLEVAPDRKKATITLPAGWHGSDRDKAQIISAVTAKLGLEAPEATWLMQGPAHKVVLAETPAPPRKATLGDVRDAIDKAKPGELVIGPGKAGRIVTVSLHTNSPHIGASMGTGGGKSTLGRLLLAQHLHRGGIGLVLDAKLISHPWTWGLPNVGYADDPAALHAAMCWLGEELTRRNRVAKAGTDVDGNVHANPGAPLMVLAEELNLTLPMLRSYWAECGGEGKSPAVTALESIAFAGRQVRIHLLMIGQMLSARATGSGEARENIGVRLLSRYTKRGWEMLAPEHAMPLASNINGRIQVVASGRVREAQVAELSPRECRDLATYGAVTPLPAGMPGRTSTPTVGAVAPAQPGRELVPAPRSGQPLTLSEAVSAGLLPMSLAAARTARPREEAFPPAVGQRGMSHLYDPVALVAWYRTRMEGASLP